MVWSCGSGGVTSTNVLFAPLVAPDIDQDANQPRLFILQSAGDGVGCARGLEERLLHEVERIVDGRGEAASQPVDSLLMSVEQRRQPGGALWSHT